jgi:hypothetical protein
MVVDQDRARPHRRVGETALQEQAALLTYQVLRSNFASSRRMRRAHLDLTAMAPAQGTRKE